MVLFLSSRLGGIDLDHYTATILRFDRIASYTILTYALLATLAPDILLVPLSYYLLRQMHLIHYAAEAEDLDGVNLGCKHGIRCYLLFSIFTCFRDSSGKTLSLLTVLILNSMPTYISIPCYGKLPALLQVYHKHVPLFPLPVVRSVMYRHSCRKIIPKGH